MVWLPALWNVMATPVVWKYWTQVSISVPVGASRTCLQRFSIGRLTVGNAEHCQFIHQLLLSTSSEIYRNGSGYRPRPCSKGGKKSDSSVVPELVRPRFKLVPFKNTVGSHLLVLGELVLVRSLLGKGEGVINRYLIK